LIPLAVDSLETGKSGKFLKQAFGEEFSPAFVKEVED